MIVLLASVGAPLRYLVDRAVQARQDSLFPWGTFAVNAAGSFLLGGLVTTGLHTPAPVMAALGIGLCGALTTYSTFGYGSDARTSCTTVLTVSLQVRRVSGVFEHLAGAGGAEDLSGVAGGGRGLRAVHVGVGAVGTLPVLALGLR